jgi:hypothetical protein
MTELDVVKVEPYQVTPSILAEGMVIGNPSAGTSFYACDCSAVPTEDAGYRVDVIYPSGGQSIRQWDGDDAMSINLWVVGHINGSPVTKGLR